MNNKGAATLIILIGLLGAGIAAFSLFKYTDIFSDVEKSKLVENKFEKAKKTKGGDLVTHTNSMFAYKLKYSPLLEEPSKDSYGFPPYPHTFTIKRDNDAGDYCSVSIYSSKTLDNFDGEIDLNTNDDKYDKKNTTIDGVSAVEFTYDKVGDAIAKSYYVTNAPFTYRIGYNYKKTGALVDFCKTEAEKVVNSFEFLDRPNFFEEGNVTDQGNKKYNMVYEKPGNPALSVILNFTDKSLCKLSTGTYKKCEYSDLDVGDRVDVWGYKNNNIVEVLSLVEK